MKKILLSLLVCFQLIANAQTVVEADTVYSDAGIFSPLSPALTLGLNVTAATTNTTTFPFAPGGGFEPEIGYVSANSTTTGTITHVFSSPESVSQVWIWNAYFDFELDHSVQNVQLVFRDESGNEIATEDVVFAEATATNLEPEVVDLSTEVVGVKEIDFVVSTLWGGNEISIRRIAYAGNQLSSVFELAPVAEEVAVYPNPAVNQVVIPVGDVSSVEMVDVLGRKMNTTFSSSLDRTELSWDAIEPGMYFLNILSSDGLFTSRIKVSAN